MGHPTQSVTFGKVRLHTISRSDITQLLVWSLHWTQTPAGKVETPRVKALACAVRPMLGLDDLHVVAAAIPDEWKLLKAEYQRGTEHEMQL
jgi:hypothetical protein